MTHPLARLARTATIVAALVCFATGAQAQTASPQTRTGVCDADPYRCLADDDVPRVLGWTCEAQIAEFEGRLHDAEALYRRVLQTMPHAVVRQRLARVLMGLGRQDDAVALVIGDFVNVARARANEARSDARRIAVAIVAERERTRAPNDLDAAPMSPTVRRTGWALIGVGAAAAAGGVASAVLAAREARRYDRYDVAADGATFDGRERHADRSRRFHGAADVLLPVAGVGVGVGFGVLVF